MHLIASIDGRVRHAPYRDIKRIVIIGNCATRTRTPGISPTSPCSQDPFRRLCRTLAARRNLSLCVPRCLLGVRTHEVVCLRSRRRTKYIQSFLSRYAGAYTVRDRHQWRAQQHERRAGIEQTGLPTSEHRQEYLNVEPPPTIAATSSSTEPPTKTERGGTTNSANASRRTQSSADAVHQADPGYTTLPCAGSGLRIPTGYPVSEAGGSGRHHRATLRLRAQRAPAHQLRQL